MKELKPGICLVENVIKNPEALIQYAEQQNRWGQAGVYLADEQSAGINEDSRKAFGQAFSIFSYGMRESFNIISTCLEQYSSKYELPLYAFDPISIVKYEPGCYYRKHVDGSSIDRSVSVVVYLNDDYVGGEIYFDRVGLEVKPSAGSALLFPSTWFYQHECKTITEGSKYIVVTWAR